MGGEFNPAAAEGWAARPRELRFTPCFATIRTVLPILMRNAGMKFVIFAYLIEGESREISLSLYEQRSICPELWQIYPKNLTPTPPGDEDEVRHIATSSKMPHENTNEHPYKIRLQGRIYDSHERLSSVSDPGA